MLTPSTSFLPISTLGQLQRHPYFMGSQRESPGGDEAHEFTFLSFQEKLFGGYRKGSGSLGKLEFEFQV